jgi:hypothetical protein
MLRYLLVLISLLPSFVFAQQLTDSQLATQLLTLIPNNTSNAITPANVRKVTQDGYDARISVYGNLGIKGLLGYNTLFTLTNDKQLVHKKYVDDKFAAIATSVLSWNGRIGTVLPQAGDYTFDQLGSKPTSISGFGIIPTFADYAAFYYPLTGNPSNFITLVQSRAGFSAPGSFFNYNSLTGVLGTSYVPLANTLSTGKIFIGNASNIATEQTPSGDIALSQSGVFTLPTINSNVGTFNNIQITGKGQAIAGSNINYELGLNKNVTGTMGNSNVQFPTEFTLRNYINSLGFYDGSAPITTETDPVFSANGVNKFGSYADPIFISSLSKSKIIGLNDPVQPDWSASSGLASILNKPTLSTVANTGNYSDLIGKPNIPGAQVNSDWNSVSGLSQILNKPTIPAAQVPSDWTAVSGVARVLNKPTLATVATTGNYADLTGKPTIPSGQVNSDWNATTGVAQILNKPTIPAAQLPGDWTASSGVTRILNKPTLATVATTGSYADLTSKPTIPAAQVNSDWAASSGITAILNKPTIPSAQVSSDWNASSGVAQILNKPNLGVYELTANKAIDMSVISNTKYVTTQLLSTQQALKQNVLGFTPENIINKNTSPYVSSSTTKYVSDFTLKSQLDSIAASGTELTAQGPIRLIGSSAGPLVDSDGNPLVDAGGVVLTGAGVGGSIISIDKADSTKDGYLSKEDYLYFYHKANAGAGGGISTETDPFYTSYGATKATTLTINGVTQDLSTNRSWTVAGGVTSVFGRTGAVGAQVGDYSGFYYPLSTNPSNFLTTTTGDARYPLLTGLGALALLNTYSQIPGIPTIPAAQIQADYTQTNTSALDYIKNKPAAVTGLTTGDKGDISVNNVTTDWSIDPNTIGSTEIVDGEVKGAELEDVLTPGTYNGGSFDANGRLISGTNTAYLTGNQTITATGDATGSGATSIALTLKNTGTPGQYNLINFDNKGREISGVKMPYLTRDSLDQGHVEVVAPFRMITSTVLQTDENGNLVTDEDGNLLTNEAGVRSLSFDTVSSTLVGVVTPAMKAYWDGKLDAISFPGSTGNIFFKSGSAIGSDAGFSLDNTGTNRIVILSQNSSTSSGFSEYRALSNVSDLRFGTGGSGTVPFNNGFSGDGYFGMRTANRILFGTNSLVRQIIDTSGVVTFTSYADVSGDRYAGFDANGKLKVMSTPGGGGGGGDGGVLTFSSVGSSPNANGATVSGTVATLQPFDATHPGVGRAVDYVRLYHASYTLKKFQSASQINTGTLTNLYLYSIPANTFSVNNDGLSGNFNFAVIKNGGDPFPPAVALMYNTDTLCKLNAADFPTGTSFAEIEFYAVSYSTAPVFNVKVTIHTGNGFSGGSATTKHYSNVAYSANYSTAQNFRLLGKGSYVSGNSGRIIFEPGD